MARSMRSIQIPHHQSNIASVPIFPLTSLPIFLWFSSSARLDRQPHRVYPQGHDQHAYKMRPTTDMPALYDSAGELQRPPLQEVEWLAEARQKAEERVAQDAETRRKAEGRVEQEAEARQKEAKRQAEKEKSKDDSGASFGVAFCVSLIPRTCE